MNQKDRAHYGHKKETNVLQFPDRKVNRQAERGAEKRKEQEQNRPMEGFEHYRKKYRKSKKLVYGIIVVTAALTWIFENFFYQFVDWISWEGLILSIPTYAVLIIDILVGAAKNDNYGYFDQNDFFERIDSAWKNIKDAWRSKPVIELLFIVVTIVHIVIIGSKYNICAKVVHAAEAGIHDFINYKEESGAKSGNHKGTLGFSAITSKTESEEKINNPVENFKNADSLYIYSEEEMIEQFGRDNYLEARSIMMTEDDRNRELNLSPDDYNDIFHLTGDYQIKDWDNQEEVNAAVLQKIQDEKDLKKNNDFDENAPGWLQNDVNEASRKEEEKHTFSKRVEIMETRAGAYDMCGKSSLAKLTSNDNQALALALVLIGGKKQTEMYYYGQAIIWGHRYFGFADVSENSVKEKANWIANRYKDIQFICSETDPEYRYSEKLAIAYENAANAF